ncbi:TetR family transcriptional regulator [Ruania suaedae]|uniref:TetR family transcriptional regulator n=1 Tax=Ruania suaedae TaxID=2897774 RepID=UPI001E495D5D|nr:TetR family transcriptional regulator [Ruania suaedae]UFU02190.1 TetR family transcriptional regulator [Ruania suaedae]
MPTVTYPRSATPAKQRVIDAGIELFGREGFDAGIRAIAARAGSAVGLVQYHFGGKEGLRSACDRQVYAALDVALPTHFHRAGLVALEPDDLPLLGHILHYLMRSLGEGGPLAPQVVMRLAAHVQGLTGVSPEGGPQVLQHARETVRFGLGATLLDYAIARPQSPEEAVAFVRRAWEKEFLPLILGAGVLGRPELR